MLLFVDKIRMKLERD